MSYLLCFRDNFKQKNVTCLWNILSDMLHNNAYFDKSDIYVIWNVSQTCEGVIYANHTQSQIIYTLSNGQCFPWHFNSIVYRACANLCGPCSGYVGHWKLHVVWEITEVQGGTFCLCVDKYWHIKYINWNWFGSRYSRWQILNQDKRHCRNSLTIRLYF